jgi:hypothetical protein
MYNTVGAKLSKIGAENPDFLQAVCTTASKKDPLAKTAKVQRAQKEKIARKDAKTPRISNGA